MVTAAAVLYIALVVFILVFREFLMAMTVMALLCAIRSCSIDDC
jgi:hypothetical protein